MHATQQKSVGRTYSGFTLFELLIVVVVLAVLAAIVIPLFSSPTVEAHESALGSNLISRHFAAQFHKV